MGHGSVPEEVNIVQVCRAMHWTVDEYLAQPQWFVELMTDMQVIEAKEQEHRSKKLRK